MIYLEHSESSSHTYHSPELGNTYDNLPVPAMEDGYNISRYRYIVHVCTGTSKFVLKCANLIHTHVYILYMCTHKKQNYTSIQYPTMYIDFGFGHWMFCTSVADPEFLGGGGGGSPVFCFP